MSDWLEHQLGGLDLDFSSEVRSRRFWRRKDPVLGSAPVVAIPTYNEDGTPQPAPPRPVVKGGMWPHQRKWWKLPTFFKVLVGGYGSGKCVKGDTEVYDPIAGVRRRVDELGPLNVASMVDGLQVSPRPATAVASGVKPCLRLRLQDGSSLALSEDHPVYTSRGWVKAEELQLGDLVGVPRSLPEGPGKDVTDDELTLVGYMLGDGGTTQNSCTFTNANNEILNDFCCVVSSCGGTFTSSSVNDRCPRVAVRGLRSLLRSFGVQNCHARDKRIPADWYGLTKRQSRVVLRAFFSCDAHVGKNHLEVGLASKGLIADLRHLLLVLGVPSRVRFRWATCNGKRFKCWKLTVYGANYRELLKQLNYIVGKEDQITRALAYFAGLGRPNTNTDVVPFGKADLPRVCKQHGLSQRDAAAFCGGRYGSLYSRGKTKLFLEHFNVTDAQLQAWVDGDITWARVTLLRPMGDHEVFDLSVEDPNHNFVANQIIVHNSFIGGKYAIAMAIENSGCPFGCVSPSYPLARKTMIPTLLELLSGKQTILGNAFWWKYRRSPSHEIEIQYRGRKGLIYIMSGDDPLSLRGPNLCGALIDEPFIQDVEVFKQMVARIRHPQATKLGMGLTGTPEQLNWGYDLCLGEMGEEYTKIGMKVGMVQASTRGNLAVGAQYVQRLEATFTGKAAQAYVDGEFINLSKGLVMYGFDRDLNVRAIPAKTTEHGLVVDVGNGPEIAELGVGMDFNVNPMAFIVFWNTPSGHMHFVEEFEVENSDTEYVCELLKSDTRHTGKQGPNYWALGLRRIFPDPSGNARKTSAPAGRTDFHYIRDAGFTVHARHAHPAIRDLENAVNGKLAPKRGPRTLTMDPSCKRLKQYYGTYSHELKNKQEAMSHLIRASQYPVEMLYPVVRERPVVQHIHGA